MTSDREARADAPARQGGLGAGDAWRCDPSAYAPLQRAFTEHAVERRYLAIVGNELVGEGSVRARIARHPQGRSGCARRSTRTSARARRRRTRYRTLAHATWHGAPITAVELRLETGRTHQIRVHMMWIGHPLVGDTAYGGAPFERLCLHAYAVELRHPRTGQPLRVSTPVPEPFTPAGAALDKPVRLTV